MPGMRMYCKFKNTELRRNMPTIKMDIKQARWDLVNKYPDWFTEVVTHYNKHYRAQYRNRPITRAMCYHVFEERPARLTYPIKKTIYDLLYRDCNNPK